MKLRSKPGLTAGTVVGLVSTLPLCVGFAVWVGGSSYSWGTSPVGSEFTVILPALAFQAVVVGAILMFFKRARTAGRGLMAAGTVSIVTFIGSCTAGDEFRMKGFEQFAERSKPLITAIEDYSSTYGQPPDSLDQLVPDFIPEIPETGVGSAPEYVYEVGHPQGYYDGNPWILKLDVGTGILNWDIFIYYPLQN